MLLEKPPRRPALPLDRNTALDRGRTETSAPELRISSYDNDMRTIVDIPEGQLAELKEICAREGISRAEAIRRAVRVYTQGLGTAGRRRAFGIWKNRKIDALSHEDQVRSEWARRGQAF